MERDRRVWQSPAYRQKSQVKFSTVLEERFNLWYPSINTIQQVLMGTMTSLFLKISIIALDFFWIFQNALETNIYNSMHPLFKIFFNSPLLQIIALDSESLTSKCRITDILVNQPGSALKHLYPCPLLRIITNLNG